MPLIVVSGLPTSGKSTRAAQLYKYLEERISSPSSASSDAAQTPATPTPKKQYRLHLISDQSLSISRTVYDLSAVPAHARSANASEKNARASIYGAVKRVLTDRDIVILDGLNYIKGWRYQLHCEAKALQTPSVVLQIGCSVDRAKSVNEARLRRRDGNEGPATHKADENQKDGSESTAAVADQIGSLSIHDASRAGTESTEEASTGDQRGGHGNANDDIGEDKEEPYEPANWENLVFRYEEPNLMTRWDSPLFALVWDDDEAQARRVFDDLWNSIAGEGRKIVRPNQATVQRGPSSGGDYLYTLDRETQDVVKRILEAQEEVGEGAAVRIPKAGQTGGGGGGGGSGSGGGNDDLVVELPGKKVGLPQLQRFRRGYVALSRGGIGLEGLGGEMSAAKMREGFVGYLNSAFEKDE